MNPLLSTLFCIVVSQAPQPVADHAEPPHAHVHAHSSVSAGTDAALSLLVLSAPAAVGAAVVQVAAGLGMMAAGPFLLNDFSGVTGVEVPHLWLVLAACVGAALLLIPLLTTVIGAVVGAVAAPLLLRAVGAAREKRRPLGQVMVLGALGAAAGAFPAGLALVGGVLLVGATSLAGFSLVVDNLFRSNGGGALLYTGAALMFMGGAVIMLTPLAMGAFDVMGLALGAGLARAPMGE